MVLVAPGIGKGSRRSKSTRFQLSSLPRQAPYIPTHGFREPFPDAMRRGVTEELPGLGNVGLGMEHVASSNCHVRRALILAARRCGSAPLDRSATADPIAQGAGCTGENVSPWKSPSGIGQTTARACVRYSRHIRPGREPALGYAWRAPKATSRKARQTCSLTTVLYSCLCRALER